MAERFNLRQAITFGTRVLSATYDDDAQALGNLHLARPGPARSWSLATGCLSAANVPDIPGLDTFSGQVLHTGRWPREEVDFAGQRVGVVGTGSSAIQAIPIIARGRGAVSFVFQCTASYCVLQSDRSRAEELARIKADYGAFRARNRAMPGGFGADLGDMASALDYSPARARRGVRGSGGSAVASRSSVPFGDTSVNKAAEVHLAADFIRRKIKGIVQ